MSQRIAWKILLPGTVLVLFFMGGAGWLASRTLEGMIVARANDQVAMKIDHTNASLEAIENLSYERVHFASQFLASQGAAIGSPGLQGATQVGAETAPGLALGGQPQTNNFALVDRVKQITGASATLFVKNGDVFVRVSTNIQNAAGARAIGTRLDPKGRAIAAMHQGQAYHGVADILGAPFMTEYVPMRDAHQNMVGIWFVGYPLTALTLLGHDISQTAILKNGFLALADDHKKIRFQSANATADLAAKIVAGDALPGEWRVVRKDFPSWGYTLVAAYPLSDVSREVRPIYLGIAGLALLIVGALMGFQLFILAKVVLRPVGTMVAALEAAAAGDLTQRLETASQDEIGRMSAAVNQTLASTEEAMGSFARDSDLLTRASEELLRVSLQMSVNAQETSEGVSGVSATTQGVTQHLQTLSAATEEMNASIGEIAHNAADAAGVSLSAVANAGQATGIMTQLDRTSTEIGAVIKVITSIAQQTNLLALNATIEAARSGEAGKGFAVVANEVKELAKGTAKATEEITQKVAAIQHDTEAAVKAIAGISAVIGRVNDIANTIAASVEQQAATTKEMAHNVADAAQGGRQVSDNMSAVAGAAASTTAGAASVQAAANELSQMAAELRTLVKHFKFEPSRQPQSVPESSLRRKAA